MLLSRAVTGDFDLPDVLPSAMVSSLACIFVIAALSDLFPFLSSFFTSDWLVLLRFGDFESCRFVSLRGEGRRFRDLELSRSGTLLFETDLLLDRRRLSRLTFGERLRRLTSRRLSTDRRDRDTDLFLSLGDTDLFRSLGDTDLFRSLGDTDRFLSLGDTDRFLSLGDIDRFLSLGDTDRFLSLVR